MLMSEISLKEVVSKTSLIEITMFKVISKLSTKVPSTLMFLNFGLEMVRCIY